MNNKREFNKSASFYNEIYYDDIDKKTGTTRHYQNLAKKIGIKNEYRVLDVACGTGQWLKVVNDLGATAFGVDISEKAIRKAKMNIPKGEFKVGTAEQLPFENDMFDLVTCLGALEHFLEQEEALREMIRVAKKKTKILILVPNANFLTYRLGIFRGTKQKDNREIILSLSEWEKLFNRAGLKVIKRWKDLHVLNFQWIVRRGWIYSPFRFLQAVMLCLWPITWQYQVYHLCVPMNNRILPEIGQK